MLKLKLQYFVPLMRKADSLEKTLMLEKIEGRRRRGQQRIRYLDSITDSIGMNWRTEAPGVLQSMGSQRAGYDLATEQQQKEHLYSGLLIQTGCTFHPTTLPGA